MNLKEQLEKFQNDRNLLTASDEKVTQVLLYSLWERLVHLETVIGRNNARIEGLLKSNGFDNQGNYLNP